ncbi:MAG: CTP-dependent riboflavin kinase [Candidatus Bathyarchaeota archaeon]|nr:CTP-dependent riboflavin kinase [Candidatus Bathyarchaeota archaeon]
MESLETEHGKQLRPHLWFTLYGLLNLGAWSRPVKVSTTELSTVLKVSQQSASRHLVLLDEMGLVSRRIDADGTLLRITEGGLRALNEVLYGLRSHLEGSEAEAFVFEGVVFSGLTQGAYYIGKSEYRDQIREKLGFDPYPGTLNLGLRGADIERRRQMERLPSVVIKGFEDRERAFGSGRCYPAVVNDNVEGALVVADRTTYDLSVMEIISPVYLRGRFGLEDGDTVKVSISSSRRSSP